MSKTKMIWIIVAVCFLVVGLLVFLGAMAVIKFDFTKLSTEKYQTNTYEASGDFDSISIDVDTTEIEFVPSENGQCKVVCFEKETEKHSVAVKDGALKIDTIDSRKWYHHIGFSFSSPKITVYLPQSGYSSLSVYTHTGNIKIPDGFAFESLYISGSTANVECDADVSKAMNINLSTGDISINNAALGEVELSVTTGKIKLNSVTCSGALKLLVSTGRTELTDVSCKALNSRGTTGKVILNNVLADGLIAVERSTGDITLIDSDAAELNINTTTGDVTGTLLSAKVFITKATTGRIDVPTSTTGGKCEIRTTTGDIRISIK